MKPTYEELEKQVQELQVYNTRLRSVITDEVVDFIRCGIDYIYSGVFYYEAIKIYYEPVVSALEETPAQSLETLKAEWNCPTIENGKNRYGLDVSYFRNIFNRELNCSLQNYKPSELARNLLRMALTADESVITEHEFTGKLKAQWQVEAVEKSWEFNYV